MTVTFPEIAAAAAAEGLRAAAFLPPADPAARARLAPPGAGQAGAVVLLGTGDGTWDRFAASAEARDGAPHPLDRWSARVAAGLALRFGARAILPSDGPPFAPFIGWALAAEPAWPSRLGPLLHAERGLWASWRAALALPALADVPAAPAPGPRPCDACAAPCLSACPVGAFAETEEGPRYDVAACAAWLERPEGAACRDRGCLARRACPVGRAATHRPAQAAFHMAAFLRARRAEADAAADDDAPRA